MKRLSFTLMLLLALSLAVQAKAQANDETCPRGSTPVDPCYKVEGTIFGANGNPTFRIHPAHSKRILGVRNAQDSGKPDMPDSLLTLLQKTDPGAGWKKYTGAFEVCPLTKQRPGHMEMVCIVRFGQVAATATR